MSAVPELSGIIQVLNTVSALAVILGVVFVVFQLRRNNELIGISNRQVEANLLQSGRGICSRVTFM